MGLHSALAIKRQRKRREEQKKARERRYSTQSTESGLGESRSSCASPRNSMGSLDYRKGKKGQKKPRTTPPAHDKVVSTVGMLHIGVVFLVLGAFLIGSGLVPDDIEHWKNPPGGSYFNEIVLAGIFALGLGIFLIILNAVLAKKEEDDLTAYVERQLNRTRSGHRLVRDVETGNLTTKHEQRAKEAEEKMSTLNTTLEDITPIHFSPTLRSPPPLSASTPRSDLERILEEEISEKGEDDNRIMERFNKETLSNNSSSGADYDTRELLQTRYHNYSNHR